mmetsp:Transcript_18518/g.26887  ORF Transcript_18518/g.26887 Transcript_18518/m.26887 type:complete len:81 (-) Transcript_18518:771-1013(-)
MSLRTLPSDTVYTKSSEISANRDCETVPFVSSEISGTVPAESRGTCVVSVRVLTSVSTLGEVNLLHDEEIVNLCDDSDCI